MSTSIRAHFYFLLNFFLLDGKVFCYIYKVDQNKEIKIIRVLNDRLFVEDNQNTKQ